MSNISILPLNESHIKGMLTVSNLSFSLSWTEASLTKELDNKFARYVVALDGSTVVGYGGMWVILDEAQITNIAVHPDYRNKHIGSLIVSELIKICKSEALYGITLEVRESNIIAQNLYTKYGFTNEGIRSKFYEDGEDAVIMWNTNLK